NAKLMVYTLCAGINPHRVLPIQLDVGTNNAELLNDPMYLGWRHERIRGKAYEDFIDHFVEAMHRKFPSVYLHWEDMGRENARQILSRYRDQACTINGDIQTTGVVALASVLAGVIASGVPLCDHRVVVFGAGAAGIGIADQIVDAMMRSGLSEQDALDRFYLLDRQGLLMEGRTLMPYQARYAKPKAALSHWSSGPNKAKNVLLEVVKNAKPTILIGCSTVAGAFNEEVVKAMAEHVLRPIILPLSNPTTLSEAKPSDLLEWTEGAALIATGSPFADVLYEGKHYRIAQSNNALAFPGIGLGVIMSKATRLTDNMLWAATTALSRCSPVHQDKTAALLPKLAETQRVSQQVAIAVAKAACRDGVAGISPETDWGQRIRETTWVPAYYPYLAL
ncbi:MAG TPA: oxaloacetate-decarboxylating malate dehydrogenase, partial [Myxococcota bacterium]|nr:oxaloacetate-decarboxylating malate dehydrogenase [Myxococcota bacterium]